MTPVFLKSAAGNVVAALHGMAFDKSSKAYVGQIEYMNVPDDVLRLWSELEKIVESQSFATLDEAQAEVDRLEMFAEFDDGSRNAVKDLYVATDRGVSFRLRSGSPI